MERIKGNTPLSIRTGPGRFDSIAEGHRHLFLWRSLAPDGDGNLALQNHVVAEDVCKLDVRMGREAAEGRESDQSADCERGRQGGLSGGEMK